MIPLLIIVSGRPGSGKTTLAQRIAEAVCCPLLCRDQLKEGYCVTADADHTQLPADTNRRLYEVFFELLDSLLTHDISCVAEAAFQHKLWAPKLARLSERCDQRVIRCTLDPTLARQRTITRGLANPRRERFHRDFAVHAAKDGLDLPIGAFTPIDCAAPTLDVDTSDGYQPDLQYIIDFIMADRGTGASQRTSAT